MQKRNISGNMLNMRNIICILLIAMLASCAPNNNSSTQASLNDTVITDTIMAKSPMPQKEGIVLPPPPEWLTTSQLGAVKEWKDDAKLELYTYMEFFNSISSLISTTIKPDSHSIRQINSGKNFISLYEIFCDTVVYYVTMFAIPPQTELLFGYQKYTIKDNYLSLAQSVPTVWIDGIEDMDCSVDLSSNPAQFYLTNDGRFFFSVDIYYGCGEMGGYNGQITSETYGNTQRYFYNCNGQKIFYEVTESSGTTSMEEVGEVHYETHERALEISTTDFSNGYPDITERVSDYCYYKRDSTKIDTSYTEIYRFNTASQKYERSADSTIGIGKTR